MKKLETFNRFRVIPNNSYFYTLHATFAYMNMIKTEPQILGLQKEHMSFKFGSEKNVFETKNDMMMLNFPPDDHDTEDLCKKGRLINVVFGEFMNS